MNGTSVSHSMQHTIVWIVVLMLFLGPPALLWGTNFCFTEWRYVSKDEMCSAALAKVPAEFRSSTDKCSFETTSVTAYSADLILDEKKVPKSYTWHHGVLFESCGRMFKFRQVRDPVREARPQLPLDAIPRRVYDLASMRNTFWLITH